MVPTLDKYPHKYLRLFIFVRPEILKVVASRSCKEAGPHGHRPIKAESQELSDYFVE